ncbi:hypothetical protein WN943_023996 [Citrus x changshan-huyou]
MRFLLSLVSTPKYTLKWKASCLAKFRNGLFTLNAKSHFYDPSNSFPTRPHPIVSQIDEHLSRLKATVATTSSSISNNLHGLVNLYDLLKNLLLLPQA